MCNQCTIKKFNVYIQCMYYVVSSQSLRFNYCNQASLIIADIYIYIYIQLPYVIETLVLQLSPFFLFQHGSQCFIKVTQNERKSMDNQQIHYALLKLFCPGSVHAVSSQSLSFSDHNQASLIIACIYHMTKIYSAPCV